MRSAEKLASIATLLVTCLAQNPVHQGTFTIENVTIFNGWSVLPRSVANSVTVTNGRISSLNPDAAPISGITIDGHGNYLFPGFIDTHVHISDAVTDLTSMRSQGVTTVFDMGCFAGKEACDAQNLARHPSSTQSANISSFAPFPELFQAYQPAIAPVGSHARMVPASMHIQNSEDADNFIAARVAEDADVIKIVCSTPGFSPDLVERMVRAAHTAGKLVVCHASDVDAYVTAAEAACDQIHHVPRDRVLTKEEIAIIKPRAKVVSPTLIQMKGIIEGRNAMPVVFLMDVWKSLVKLLRGGGFEWDRPTYAVSRDNLRLLFESGVLLVHGTDATGMTGPVAFSVHMASGFQKEIYLLRDAGVDTSNIFTGMTGRAAMSFGLTDRGTITEGVRADLVLVKGNPFEKLEDITQVEQVWIGGIATSIAAPDSAGESLKDEL